MSQENVTAWQDPRRNADRHRRRSPRATTRRAVDLAPAELAADLVDDRAHLGCRDVDREPDLVRGVSGRGGIRAVARQIEVVQLDLLVVGPVRRLRAPGCSSTPYRRSASSRIAFQPGPRPPAAGAAPG